MELSNYLGCVKNIISDIYKNGAIHDINNVLKQMNLKSKLLDVYAHNHPPEFTSK